jgi:hypothetical protein
MGYEPSSSGFVHHQWRISRGGSDRDRANRSGGGGGGKAVSIGGGGVLELERYLRKYIFPCDLEGGVNNHVLSSEPSVERWGVG